MITTDNFVILNGPEDGTEFPIVRAPFHIGYDPACAVNVRLDPAVGSIAAHVTAVSDGYRVRRTNGTPVFVDGKRAGKFRSRIVRSGGSVQVGQTLVGVECVPDGLASRSRGMIVESDLAWAARRVVGAMLAVVRALLRWFARVVFRLVKTWWLAAIVIGMLYYFWPRIVYLMRYGWYLVQGGQ